MPDYKIRTALRSDLDAIYTIFSQADTLHREAHPEIFRKVDDPAEIKDFLLTGIKSDDAVIFVADLSGDTRGDIIGAVIAWVRHTPDVPLLVPRVYLSVDNLIVDEKYQHQGVGKALMERVHEWASARALKTIHLTVWDFNQGALTFYEKLGYKMLHHHMQKEL